MTTFANVVVRLFLVRVQSDKTDGFIFFRCFFERHFINQVIKTCHDSTRLLFVRKRRAINDFEKKSHHT